MALGTTFKVVEISRDGGSDLGAYVAKVVRDEADGQRVLDTYRIGRSHIRHSSPLDDLTRSPTTGMTLDSPRS